MLRIVICASMLGIAMPASASAQQWTREQQEVIAAIKGCWDTWMEGVRQGSPDAWLSQCAAPEFTYWGPEGAPSGAAAIRREWEEIRRTDRNWVDLRPLAVRIYGDMAVTHFYGYWKANTPDGPVTTEWKRTEIFRRVGGNWLLVAGHSSPASAEDYAPYEKF